MLKWMPFLCINARKLPPMKYFATQQPKQIPLSGSKGGMLTGIYFWIALRLKMSFRARVFLFLISENVRKMILSDRNLVVLLSCLNDKLVKERLKSFS